MKIVQYVLSRVIGVVGGILGVVMAEKNQD